MFSHVNPENFENSLKSPYKVKMKVGLFFDCGQPLLEISVHSFLSQLPALEAIEELVKEPEEEPEEEAEEDIVEKIKK